MDGSMNRRRIDSVLLGGALALTGVMQRRVGDNERRAEERLVAAADVPVPPPPAPTPTSAPSIPGMPLPTGYGLQVRGPLGESIVLPVCLPPGFELDSMMLCPEFLPRVEASSAPAAPTPAPPAHPVAPAPPARHAAPPARPARPDPGAGAGRLDGVLQLVFGADQRFSSSLEHTESVPEVSTERERLRPEVPTSERSTA
jgi:hypothetical protein